MTIPQTVNAVALCGHSHCRRAAFRPKNVARRILVPVMNRAAMSAHPFSYSQALSAFRAADCTAVRTGCGSPSFVGFDIDRPVPHGFVFEHSTEHRPASVRNGFRQFRLLKLSRIHIADNDLAVSPHKFRRLLVQKVSTRVSDFGVYGLRASFIARPLRDGKPIFIGPKDARVSNPLAIGQNGQVFQAKIDTDLPAAAKRLLCDLALKADIPSPSRVLRKATRLNGAAERPAVPEMEMSPSVSNNAISHANVTSAHGNPAETFAAAETGASTARSARPDEKLAYLINRVGLKIKFDAAAGAQLHKVVSGRPFAAPALGMALRLTQIIPNVIRRTGVARQVSPCRSVFDAIAVRQDHGRILA